MKKRAALLALGLAAVGPIVTPDSASASAWYHCNNVQSSCGVFYSAIHQFSITDETCDGRYVYLKFKYAGQETRVENHNGCGTTRDYGPVSGMKAGTTVLWDVCTEINNLPDACGGWVGAYVD